MKYPTREKKQMSNNVTLGGSENAHVVFNKCLIIDLFQLTQFCIKLLHTKEYYC